METTEYILTIQFHPRRNRMWRVLILMAILCTAVGYLGSKHPLVTEQEQARLNCMADPTLMGCGDPDYR